MEKQIDITEMYIVHTWYEIMQKRERNSFLFIHKQQLKKLNV